MSYRVTANHAHVFPESINPNGTIDRLLRLMDECQIDEAICFAPFPYQIEDKGIHDQNQWLADELKKYPRLYGFGTIDPHEDLRERVKAITGGRGADVIYDPVGGDVFDASLRCVAWGGRIVVIGFASGRIPQAPANLLLVKNIDVIGFYWGSYQARKPELLRDSYKTLFKWFEEGKLKPRVSHRLEISKVAEAMNLLRERKATGKVVLTMA